MIHFIIISILAIICSYIKLFNEKKKRLIGTISILRITSFYLFFVILIAVFYYLNMAFVYEFIFKLFIIVVAIISIIYSFLTIISKDIRKNKIFEIFLILLNIAIIVCSYKFLI